MLAGQDHPVHTPLDLDCLTTIVDLAVSRPSGEWRGVGRVLDLYHRFDSTTRARIGWPAPVYFGVCSGFPFRVPATRPPDRPPGPVRTRRARPAHAGPDPVPRAAVLRALREITFQGATGVISFRDSRIGNDRNLAILTITNVREVEGRDGVPTCALMIGTLYSERQPRQPNGCPVVR